MDTVAGSFEAGAQQLKAIPVTNFLYYRPDAVTVDDDTIPLSSDCTISKVTT